MLLSAGTSAGTESQDIYAWPEHVARDSRLSSSWVPRTSVPRQRARQKPCHFSSLIPTVTQHHFWHILFVRAKLDLMHSIVFIVDNTVYILENC